MRISGSDERSQPWSELTGKQCKGNRGNREFSVSSVNFYSTVFPNLSSGTELVGDRNNVLAANGRSKLPVSADPALRNAR